MKLTKPNTSFRKLYAFGKKLPIDLSLSENPLGCSPQVIEALKKVSQKDCFNYPDPENTKLVSELANKFRINQDMVLVSNGSESLIKLLAEVVIEKGDEVVIPTLTFPMFEVASQLAEAKVVLSKMNQNFDIDLNDINKRITSKTKLIFLCNPNNPTGKILKKKAIIKFIKQTDAFVIVDEANIEFGGESVIREVNQLDNLIVLRTFSKGFGLAGLRVGFCAANSKVIQALKMVHQPFPINSLVQIAAVAALKDIDFMIKTKKFMNKERRFLTEALLQRGFEVIESKANNLLVKVAPLFDSSDEFVNKLSEEGVSVVNGTAFRGLERKFVRVSPRLRKTNKQFIKKLDEIIDTC